MFTSVSFPVLYYVMLATFDDFVFSFSIALFCQVCSCSLWCPILSSHSFILSSHQLLAGPQVLSLSAKLQEVFL